MICDSFSNIFFLIIIFLQENKAKDDSPDLPKALAAWVFRVMTFHLITSLNACLLGIFVITCIFFLYIQRFHAHTIIQMYVM